MQHSSTALLQELVPDINMLIYLPEKPFLEEKFIADATQKTHDNSKLLIVVSEGLKNKNGSYISTRSNNKDTYGHNQLGGVGRCLLQNIKENIIEEVKLAELGTLQRCAMHCVSKIDMEEAEMEAPHSVKYALNGYSGYMTTLKRKRGPYTNAIQALSVWKRYATMSAMFLNVG